jgi:hypothetical protein
MNKPAYLETGGQKGATRATLVEAVKEHLPAPQRILLMPGEEAHDAALFKQAFPRVKVSGLDKSDEKAAHLEANHWQSIDYIHSASVNGYLYYCKKRDDPENPDRGRDVFRRMDVIWLDHTGVCSAANVKDIIEMVEHAAKDKCIFAVTFSSITRGKAEEVDGVIRDNAWLDDDEWFDAEGQPWTNAADERKVLNTPDKVANAVRSAIEKGYVGPYDGRTQSGKFRRLEIIHSEQYRSRSNSQPMHFFIMVIEKS